MTLDGTVVTDLREWRPRNVVVERSRGSAYEFHHRVPSVSAGRTAIWVHEVTRPAIVRGSSQPDDVIDRSSAESAGWEVSDRRSGGGVVVVEPDESAWVDVLVPRSHCRWDDDVNRSFVWVGEWWASALSLAGVSDLEVHRGGIAAREHGHAVCFAGWGPGEVIQRDRAGSERDARKIVGLSQRRTREVSRFQGLYLRQWNPDPIKRFMRADALPADLNLGGVRAGLAGGPDPAVVVSALIALADSVAG